MTTCEALTPRATSRMASAGSAPVTVCHEPPSSSVRRRSAASPGSGGPLSPSARATCTASSSPPAPREAIRAPRRSSVSPSGPPDSATTTRSRVGQRRVDAVVGAVPAQPLVDPVGEPQQRQLAQGRQVADPEVVRQRGVDLLGLVDVAVGHPAAQRLRRHVDELDLVGPAHHLVGHRLPLHHTGDRLDDVVERLEVLDVDRRDHVDPGIQQLVDVLPALLVARPRHVGVRELVDQRHRSGAGQQPVEVHLLERRRPGARRRARGSTSSPSTISAVCSRPWVSTRPTTTSVPRASRRRPSSSMATVLPTPGAAPR